MNKFTIIENYSIYLSNLTYLNTLEKTINKKEDYINKLENIFSIIKYNNINNQFFNYIKLVTKNITNNVHSYNKNLTDIIKENIKNQLMLEKESLIVLKDEYNYKSLSIVTQDEIYNNIIIGNEGIFNTIINSIKKIIKVISEKLRKFIDIIIRAIKFIIDKLVTFFNKFNSKTNKKEHSEVINVTEEQLEKINSFIDNEKNTSIDIFRFRIIY